MVNESFFFSQFVKYNFDRPTFCSLNVSDDDLIGKQYSWAPIVYALDVHRQRNQTNRRQLKKKRFFDSIDYFRRFIDWFLFWRKMPNLLASVDFVWAITRKTRPVIRRKCFTASNAAIQVENLRFQPQNSALITFNFISLTQGHPSCLQYSEKLVSKIRTMPWQCIDCKQCMICKISDESVRPFSLFLLSLDQILF